MADEKQIPPEVEAAPVPAPAPADGPAPEVQVGVHNGEPIPRPPGWMYKGFRIGGNEVWYASPIAQLLMVALVCFMCPGMFNALTGLGGGGQLSTTTQDNANVALYSTFSVVAFFSGTIANVLGVRLTLSIGGLGYCLYVASFLAFNVDGNQSFNVAAGAILGVCAGLLWTAQGTIMVSYPTEKNKGHYISWFWIIFNLGAVIGSLIPLGQNINNKNAPVSNGTYAGFLALTIVGALLGLCLCNANKVIRDDGSKVILMKNPSWVTEFKGLFETIVQSPWVILLFPMFFASNVFYTYQGNSMNAPHFNTRTRALNNTLYWSAQIFGAIIFGYSLDIQGIRRSVRAKAGFIALFSLTFIIWGGGWAWQRLQVVRYVAEHPDITGYVTVDWTDGGKLYIGPMFLYIFYGFYDAAWQTSIYWYMGALSNSGRKAANLTGFYKAFQSAGAVVFWRLDALKKPYDTMFGATWGLLAASLVIAAPVIWFRVTDTVTLEQDLKFSDETAEDVLGVSHKEQEQEQEV